MADLTRTKDAVGGTVQTNAVETEWDDASPLITPTEVRRLHLFGVPLVSAIRNILTGKPDIIDDPLLDQHIKEAVTLAEAELGIEIFPRAHEESQPYDLQLQNSFGYTVLRHRPIQSVQEMSVVSSDGVNIFTIPLAWIHVGLLVRGQIGILPLAIAGQSGTVIPITSPVGLGLLPSLLRFNWVANFWRCKYTTGFKNSSIPKIVNQLIGVVAAMEVLSMLATTYRVQSSSLGIDGLSQSMSLPGQQIFQTRLEYLAGKRKWLISRIKKILGLGIFVDNI